MQPLVKRKLFPTELDAARSLARDYVLSRVNVLQAEMAAFERKYGMRFEQFSDYLHERSTLLVSGQLSVDQQKALGQAIMTEEDDWLDWKATQEMLDSWLGLREDTANA
jgi:hypothetical protein